MAHNDKQDDMFERSLEKWTDSFTFVRSFTIRAITSTRFERPAAKFICAKIENSSNKIDNSGNGLGLWLSSPPTYVLVSDSSVVVQVRKLETKETKKTD